ncbi:13844_t:CDS:2, partial [Gigaspora rosea]
NIRRAIKIFGDALDAEEGGYEGLQVTFHYGDCGSLVCGKLGDYGSFEFEKVVKKHFPLWDCGSLVCGKLGECGSFKF